MSTHPRRQGGQFAFLYTSSIRAIAFRYLLVLTTLIAVATAFIDLRDPTGQIEPGLFEEIYFVVTNMASPGFTEFVPAEGSDRLIVLVTSVFGLAGNALFLTLIVTRVLRPREPFQFVDRVAFDPGRNQMVFRLYQRLPVNIYALNFTLHWFSVRRNQHGDLVGTSREIQLTPVERQLLRPMYGLLVKAKVSESLDSVMADAGRADKREAVPVEWMNDPRGHFYFTASGDSMFGRLYQTQDYFSPRDVAVGKHVLLNEGLLLGLRSWYDWTNYRWDLWGEIEEIEGVDETHPIIEALSTSLPVMQLKFSPPSGHLDEIVIDFEVVDEVFVASLPDRISGELGRVDGEVFVFVDSNISIPPDSSDEFQIGDLVYWRSEDGKKQALAFFFGTTRFGDGTKPRAKGPAHLIARALDIPPAVGALKKHDIMEVLRTPTTSPDDQ